MTVPKKPLTKNESAIQLGNVLKYASRGGSTKAGILSKIKKLLIKPKPTKNSNPTPLQTALGVGATMAGVYGALGGKPFA